MSITQIVVGSLYVQRAMDTGLLELFAIADIPADVAAYTVSRILTSPEPDIRYPMQPTKLISV